MSTHILIDDITIRVFMADHCHKLEDFFCDADGFFEDMEGLISTYIL